MNKQPVRYWQTDARWRSLPYRVPGENATIGDSGCGPTCAAMLIETIRGGTYTPVDACKWSVDHGFKALKQGTYYTYFAAQFKAFGIDCWQLNWTSGYHNPSAACHDKAMEYLKKGYYIIALMKKGLWTSGGHFVVVWWEDGKIRINDPASTNPARLVGDPATFRNEVAYYWVVDGRSVNCEKPEKEDDEMITQEQFDSMFEIAMNRYLNKIRTTDAADWSQKARQYCTDKRIFEGDGSENPNFMWEDFVTKEVLAQTIYNIMKNAVKPE